MHRRHLLLIVVIVSCLVITFASTAALRCRSKRNGWMGELPFPFSLFPLLSSRRSSAAPSLEPVDASNQKNSALLYVSPSA